MRKIEFVYDISNEMCEIIDANKLVVTCLDDTTCEISDSDLCKLQLLASEAFAGGDIIIIE